MRALVPSAAVLLAFALAAWPQPGRAQSARDFVFTDEEGHLVVRFPGTGSTGIDSSQAEEILNAELSSMVHDRLRADLLFEAEPADEHWAASMEPQIEKHFAHAVHELTGIFVECRAVSCRVVLEQRGHWTVTEHRAVLETAQQSVEAFIAAQRQHFEPVFMLAAYDQEPETAHIKVFLRRTRHRAKSAGGVNRTAARGRRMRKPSVSVYRS